MPKYCELRVRPTDPTCYNLAKFQLQARIGGADNKGTTKMGIWYICPDHAEETIENEGLAIFHIFSMEE